MINGGYYVGKINRLSNRKLNQLLTEKQVTDFNSEQGRILHALWQEDAQSQSTLSKHTGLSLNTLTKMLDRMRMMKLITIRQDEQDKRRKIICLTDHAKSLKKDYDQISEEMTAIFYRGFSTEEIELAESFLARIAQNFEE